MALRICTVTVLLCLSLLTSKATGQNASPVWKKTVSRVIDWQPVHTPESHHLKDMKKDTAIFEIIANLAIEREIQAFESPDFMSTMSGSNIRKLFKDKTDTVNIVDPITGDERTVVTTLPFKYSFVHKYRVIEEWTFDPNTMKTNITIIGIAPMIEVYSNGDAYIGLKPLFWLRYSDVKKALSGYEQYHPDNTLAALVWKDYFSSDEKPGEVK